MRNQRFDFFASVAMCSRSTRNAFSIMKDTVRSSSAATDSTQSRNDGSTRAAMGTFFSDGATFFRGIHGSVTQEATS